MKKKLFLIIAMAFVLSLVLAFSVFAADSVPQSGRLGTNTIIEGIALPSVIDTESQIEMDDGLIYPSFYFFKDQTSSAWDFSKVKNEDGTDKYNIDNVIKLEIPHGITYLTNMGYRDQGKKTLTHVRIPNTITGNSWNGGFRSTSSLSSVEFEEGYSHTIFGSMFYGCPVNNFVIPEGVTAIESESMCQMGLTTITIPDSVTVIGSRAFSGNTKLKEVIISPTSNLKTIEGSAFAGLHALTEPFYFPSSLEYLGSWAFSSSYYISAFLNLENTKITAIYEGTFYEGYEFTSITIPSTVTRIDLKAFNKCFGLQTVTINGNALTTIGNNAFDNCTKLSSINVPDSIKSYGNGCFKGCSSLTEINLPNGLETIDSFAFVGTGLTSVVVPNSVTYFGTDVFNGCSKLVSATLPDHFTSIPLYTFYNCKSLESFYMSDNVTYIGQYAFYSCEKLGPLYLSKNIETIYSNGTSKQGVFQNCVNMYFVNNPGDTEKPEVYVFPESLINLGGASIKNCTNLNTTLVFHANLKYLDDDGWNFGNMRQATTRNIVFLGEITELKFANENWNTNFYFVNPNVTSETLKLTLTHSTAPTNSYAIVCSEGLIAQLTNAPTWTSEGYYHITNPEGRKETPATCTLPKMVADYCYCGKFIEGTEVTEGVALGHNYTGAVTYIFTTAEKEGSECTVCVNGCGEDLVVVIAPVYRELGYSAKTFGTSFSFTNGYAINRESLELYEREKGVSLKFGFAFNLAEGFTSEEVTLDSFAIKTDVVNQTDDIKFSMHEFVINYGNSDYLDTNIIVGAYVMECAGENESLYFINRDGTSETGIVVNGFEAVSFNYVKNTYGD